VEAVLKDNTIKQSWIILICLVWISAVSCNPNISPTPAAIEPLTTARATATHIQTPTPTISIPTQTPTAENMTLIVTPTESSVTSTPTERQHHTIIPIEDLSCPIGNEQLTAEGIPSSLDMQWSDDGQSLIYGRSNTQGPSYVQFLPYYQSWWQYNVESRCEQALPPLQTRVTNAVRQSLGICPFNSPETATYPCLSTLQESPISNRIVYSSGTLGFIDRNTWLANLDGSDSIYLEDIRGGPEDVIWSSTGQWLLIGHYWGVDGSHLYYLVSSDGTFVENLEELTSTSHFRVQGPKPAFSPDGQKLAFVGIETDGEPWNGKPWSYEILDQEEAYNIYILDLNTLAFEIVSPRFGLIQWSQDGSGLYVLDGAANTSSHTLDYILGGVQYTDFYYIDLTQETYSEQKLAGDIPLYLPYISAWAYSPEANAMAGTFDLNGPTFSTLFLEE
jgi:hypothetical protein